MVDDTIAQMTEKMNDVAKTIGTAIGMIEVVASEAGTHVQQGLSDVVDIVSDTAVGKSLNKKVRTIKKKVGRQVASTKKAANKKVSAAKKKSEKAATGAKKQATA